MDDAITLADIETLFAFLKKLLPALITVTFNVLQEDNFLNIAAIQQTIPQSGMWILLMLYLFGLLGGLLWLLYYSFGIHDVSIIGRGSPLLMIGTDILESLRRRGKGEKFELTKSTKLQIQFVIVIFFSLLPYFASFFIRDFAWWNAGGRETYFYIVATIGCVQLGFFARWVLKLLYSLILAFKDIIKGVLGK